MRIAFVHYPGRLDRLAHARSGEAPTEFLFGAIELERDGHETWHFEVDPGAPVPRLATLVDRGAGLGHLPPHLTGAGLLAVRRLLRRLREADVVVGTTTGTAMALAGWRRAGRLDRPLVGVVAGLLNQPWRRTRRATTLPLLRSMHAVLYGSGELAGMLALDRRLAQRVHVNRFGVDTRFWSPVEAPPSVEVLAIGNDGHRDWEALVRAAPGIPAPIRILTRHRPPPGLPPNVSWEDADWYTQVRSDAEIRELYRSATAVVVPVRDVPQPSGQSVTLQAMACGRPVVLTRSRGLWAPETLHDGENVVLVPPGDAEALAAAVRGLLGDPGRAAAIGAEAQAGVVRDGTVEAYAGRLLDICNLAIERP